MSSLSWCAIWRNETNNSINSISDVRGIEVGQAQDDEALTGCTVILCRKGAVAGVDVRGGAPGTRETDLLNPVNLVEKVHAVVLAGGSAFGLDAASGVMRYLEEKKIGFNTGAAKVPIVPSAILYDLNLGRADVRPDPAMGYRAAASASSMRQRRGTRAQVQEPPLERCLAQFIHEGRSWNRQYGHGRRSHCRRAGGGQCLGRCD